MPFAQMSPSAQGLRTRSQETLRVARVRSTFDAPEQQALEIVALQREKEKERYKTVSDMKEKAQN